jgi:hypothetical protein
MFWLYKHDPARLVERYRAPGWGEQRGWDVYVIYAIAGDPLFCVNNGTGA